MKIDFIADTNFIIYVHEGKSIIEPFLAYDFGISFITEVELLGYKGLSNSEENQINSILNDCFNIGWNTKIKDSTVFLRRNYNLKLPDAIIAATSIAYETPLVSADKNFSTIKELDLILIDLDKK